MDLMGSLGKISSYRLLERIAEGGMAEVFLAVSQGMGNVNKYVAIKRMLHRYHNNPDLCQMFKDEAHVVIQLRHPNIAAVYDFNEEDDLLYMVMEYVDGKPVSRFRQELFQRKVDLPLPYALYIIREAAAGLSYAHRFRDIRSGQSLNLVHRDLSPHNILIGCSGDVKLIDFGVAKSDLSETHTSFGVIKGKLGYLSPEQALYQPITQKTDLFALGIILWEILTNQRMFNLQSQEAYFKQLRQFQMVDPRPLNPKIDNELYMIMDRLLKLDPDERYESAEALHQDLNLYMNSQFPSMTMSEFAKFLGQTLPEWQNFQSKYNDKTLSPEKTQFIDTTSGDRHILTIKRTIRVIQQS
jgi:serine/threonine protein kinase